MRPWDRHIHCNLLYGNPLFEHTSKYLKITWLIRTCGSPRSLWNKQPDGDKLANIKREHVKTLQLFRATSYGLVSRVYSRPVYYHRACWAISSPEPKRVLAIYDAQGGNKALPYPAWRLKNVVAGDSDRKPQTEKLPATNFFVLEGDLKYQTRVL